MRLRAVCVRLARLRPLARLPRRLSGEAVHARLGISPRRGRTWDFGSLLPGKPPLGLAWKAAFIEAIFLGDLLYMAFD